MALSSSQPIPLQKPVRPMPAIRGPRCRDSEADEQTALAALNAPVAIPLPPTVSISASDPDAEAGRKCLLGKLRPAQGDGG